MNRDKGLQPLLSHRCSVWIFYALYLRERAFILQFVTINIKNIRNKGNNKITELRTILQRES